MSCDASGARDAAAEKPQPSEEARNVSDQQSGDLEEQKHREEDASAPLKVLVPIISGLYLCMFLVALDRTIISTAIPIITNEFHSLGDVGWYGSAYLLTACSTQLVIGRVFTFYSQKWVFLTCIAVFEIGSAICGAAPNSTAFIIGRAIAGLGSAGVFAGGILLIIPLVSLRMRAAIQGMAGAIFGIASVIGPLVGGAFTDNVTWRWCFYLNLPIGGFAMLVMFFVLKDSKPPLKADLSIKNKIKQLDPIGTTCFMPSIICLLLALEWGGSTYAWSNGRIIALFVIFGVLIIGFVAVQILKPDTATVPPRIVKQRTIAAGAWFTFCNSSAMMVMLYYLPIWFQAIKGVSAVKSGIMSIPLVLGLVVASIMTGILVSKLGYYTPFLILSSILASTGAGLLTTFKTNTGHAYWIGYQVLFGLGLGFGQQQTNIAVQVVLKKEDVPMGTTLIFFATQLGGAIFVSVSENLFTSNLASSLAGISGLDPAKVVKSGATEIRNVVNADQLPAVLEAYNNALMKALTAGLVMACFSILGSAAMEWRSVKNGKNQLEREAEKRAKAKSAGDSSENQASSNVPEEKPK
ncbi:putative MFS multidrug transporter [Saccharata proteae CBS 121410]|uniref:MFS multidrug transporter n=1 Tax=Saccharata proteae CBS 121410 TaxID=1314787 RepID=A0A9P4HZR3_9PEZI|nr:putative MFS multidrug transporter [Saccharata proteae CBS 121410]